MSKDDRHRLSRNLKEEFINVNILSKTRDAAIMDTLAYITANEHMAKLHACMLEGMRVLQMARVNKLTRDPTSRRHTGVTQQHQI
jgi:hypothetical protein